MTFTATQIDALRQNVAAALDVHSRHITIERWELSPGERSVRSWGRSLGEQFFAKTLLCEPYRVMPRITLPWDDRVPRLSRSTAEQIEIEWNTTFQLRRLAGTENIPVPMGKSLATKTIVWHGASGEVLDDMVKRQRLFVPRESARAALLEAGVWLRRVHDRSSQRSENLDLGHMVQGLRDRIRQAGQSSCLHATTALQVLESTVAEIGKPVLNVPVVLSHGDFMMANLLWNDSQRRLFIVDFENFAAVNMCQDLLSLIFDLRSQMLNPLISKRFLLSLEKSFWAGYGPIAPKIQAFVCGVASARVFYYHLPQALQKRKQKGGWARAAASVYQAFLEPSMLARCLEAM
ncbi:MAG: phosphotransferase [Acidobacteriia bacterium]|nr:phosphotransferase [Terriglobia bacterium]